MICVRQKPPANRDPFPHDHRITISIDTLKQQSSIPDLRRHHRDVVVILYMHCHSFFNSRAYVHTCETVGESAYAYSIGMRTKELS